MLLIACVGTQFFDDNWFLSGSGEHKLTHIMDFIDVSIYLKQTGLTKKLGLMGEGPSGSLTSLVSTFREPKLFDSVVVHNPITDLLKYLYEGALKEDGELL